MTTGRRGFTVAEVMIVMAILAILSAILIPMVTGQLRRGQASALADQLNNLRTAITNYQTNVNRYPTVLTQLTTQPVAGQTDLCGTALPPGSINGWRGPYLAQNILGNFPVGDVTVENDVVRNPLTTPPATGQLQINVAGVDSTIYVDVGMQFDGDTLSQVGTILYNYATKRLTFQMPIRNC